MPKKRLFYLVIILPVTLLLIAISIKPVLAVRRSRTLSTILYQLADARFYKNVDIYDDLFINKELVVVGVAEFANSVEFGQSISVVGTANLEGDVVTSAVILTPQVLEVLDPSTLESGTLAYDQDSNRLRLWQDLDWQTLPLDSDIPDYLFGDGITENGSDVTAVLGSAITSDEITDATITNADIATDAAIPFSKLNIAKSDITSLGIPGSDTDTTYTAGSGLTLTGTTLSSNLGTSIESSEITDSSVVSADILTDTITTSDLSGTLTLSDGDFVDFSAIDYSTAVEGLKLPQATNCSLAINEGQVCWDTDDNILYSGDSSGITKVNNPFGSAVDSSEITDDTITTSDISTDGVGSSEIVSGAVGTSEINDNTISNADLADDTVDWDKMSDSPTLDAATILSRSGTSNENSLTITLNNNGGTAGTDQVLVISNALVSNTTGDLNTEALLVLDQADTTVSGTTILDDALLITNSGGATLTDAIQIGSGSQVIANAINIASTGVTTDLSFQNGETIDNNTDGTLNLTATTTSLSGGLTIGGGTTILKHLSGTASNLISSAISTITCGSYGTITVAGANVGDTVVTSPDPSSSSTGIEDNNLSWSAYVSSTNTVTITACNPTLGSINAGDDQEWRADVWQH